MDITVIPVEGYETVLQCHDKRSGLQAIISIHNTTLGPALGSMRMAHTLHLPRRSVTPTGSPRT